LNGKAHRIEKRAIGASGETGDNENMRFSKKLSRFAVAAAMATAIATVAGCREEEQGRPLILEKGTYLGKPDQKLTEAQEQELRARARNQAF
jgi:hypothetical protein